MFKNYIFDLYGTLIDIRTNEESAELWAKMTLYYGYKGAHYTSFELRQKYQEFASMEKHRVVAEHPDYQFVDFDLTEVFKKLYEYKGVHVSTFEAAATARVFRCYSTEKICLYEGVIDLLETLKKKKKRIYLLSNAQHDFTIPEINMLGLDKYFDDIIISSDVNCSKPDTHIYEILFKRHNLRKKDSIMIGNDCNSDIKSAYNFGIKSLYIHQEISSPITERLKSTWRIMNGDVTRIKKMIVR
ncbi:MAG: HAD family hydrolase [Ruminococcus sp.]